MLSLNSFFMCFSKFNVLYIYASLFNQAFVRVYKFDSGSDLLEVWHETYLTGRVSILLSSRFNVNFLFVKGSLEVFGDFI